MVRTAGIVLAGGTGERLGHVFKPALRLNGRRLLDNVIAAFEPQVSRIIISTGNHPPHRFAPWPGYDLVPDDSKLAVRGPAAGLLSCIAVLDDSDADYLLTVSADAPDLPRDLSDRLAGVVGDHVDAGFARFEGQVYPTHALWRVDALRRLVEQAGMCGEKSPGLRHLLRAERITTADWPVAGKANPFASLNTLGDLVRMARKTGR